MIRPSDNPLASVDPELDALMVALSEALNKTFGQAFEAACKSVCHGKQKWSASQRCCAFGELGEIFIITTIKKESMKDAEPHVSFEA